MGVVGTMTILPAPVGRLARIAAASPRRRSWHAIHARRLSPLALAFVLVAGLAPAAIAADTTDTSSSAISAAEKQS